MGCCGSNPARLALSLLEDQAAELLLMGTAPSSQQVYSSAQQAYRQFCSRLKLSPLLTSQDQLILFVTELALTGAPSTIRTYLAGIRRYHIILGYPNPLQETPKLSLILKGIQRTKPLKSRPRLPIPPYILHAIEACVARYSRHKRVIIYSRHKRVLIYSRHKRVIIYSPFNLHITRHLCLR